MTTHHKTILACGLEIEAEYNTQQLGQLETDEHHGSEPINYGKRWIIEQDGSLETTEAFNDHIENFGETAEFISLIFASKDYTKVLKSFQRHTFAVIARKKHISIAQAQQTELSEIFHFNHSTGAHIHLSLFRKSQQESTITYKGEQYKFEGKPIRITPLLASKYLNGISKKVLDSIKAELPECYEPIKEAFYRQYSKKEAEYFTDNRYQSWNVSTKNFGFELEYRSFNLQGIKTWAQFFKAYGILFSALERAFRHEANKKTPFKSSDVITEKAMSRKQGAQHTTETECLRISEAEAYPARVTIEPEHQEGF